LNEEEQSKIYHWIQTNHVKEVRVEEIRAIRKELERMELVKAITNKLSQAHDWIPVSEENHDSELESPDTFYEQNRMKNPESRRVKSVHQPETTSSGDSQSSPTLERIHSLVPSSNAENIKRRILLSQIDRIIRQIDRWDQDLMQSFTNDTIDYEVRCELERLIKRLNHTVGWLRKKL
jgi:hypothetical protein